MRLGFDCAFNAADLEKAVPRLDQYGCSAIWVGGLQDLTDDECAVLGSRARELDVVLGEMGMWDNLMTDDEGLRNQRINLVRTLLKKADIAGVKCVVTLVGSKDPSGSSLAPHPYMYTEEAKKEFREVVLRILDGLDLRKTAYAIEPWHNSFFYQPEDVREFIDGVDHPRFGVHLDQMNMISQKDFFNTTGLINRTFDLLADKVLSVHLKDVRWDFQHLFVKWDEVRIGDGVMDYDTYLKRLAQLPPDITCFCEHFAEEGDYAICFARLHYLAKKAGVHFIPRSPGR